MSHQVALTVITRIKSGETEALKQLLNSMSDNSANNNVIPFGKLSRTHFARFMVLDESTGSDGSVIAPGLVFMMDCDAPQDRNLKELVDVAGAGLDKIFCHCEDYPCSGKITSRQRLAYLRAGDGADGEAGAERFGLLRFSRPQLSALDPPGAARRPVDPDGACA